MDKGAAKGSRTAADAVDLIAVVTVTVALAILLIRLWRNAHAPQDAVIVAVMLAAGYLVADLLTGFVHWFCDTFFDESTPLIGPGLISPFRDHHREPLLMTGHGVLELTGSSFRGLAPLLAAFVWLAESSPIGLSAFVFALAAGSAVTNLLHRWAHEPTPPLAVRILHRTGLVLTPERHRRHHAPPYAAAYCVTTGWMNPICERLKLWERAESALKALGLPVSQADRP